MTDPTDWRALCAELSDAMNELSPYLEAQSPVPVVTKAIKVWGKARTALAQPEPQGPGSYAPFIVKHYSSDDRPSIKGNGFDGLEVGEDRQEAEEFINWINARLFPGTIRPAIEPVPVAERLPGPEDCDGEGKCYAWDGYWWLVRSTVLEEDDTGAGEGYTHWLPANALPVPQQGAE